MPCRGRRLGGSRAVNRFPFPVDWAAWGAVLPGNEIRNIVSRSISWDATS